MAIVTMKQLLESGVHFGHQTRRWNPKMKPFIYMERGGIHIMDLQKTVKMLKTAMQVIREVVENGGHVLFVGTKKQAQKALEEQAKRCDMYYVSNRWLGGMLTNFKTIRRSIRRLQKLEQMKEDDSMKFLPKKEIMSNEHEIVRLNRYLSGIKDMKKHPQLLFVIDPKKESIAVHEANKIGIPVVAVVDSNCDPSAIDHCIPGNDDAIRSITLFLSIAADTIIEARGIIEQEAADESASNDENKEVVAEVPAAEAAENLKKEGKWVGYEDEFVPREEDGIVDDSVIANELKPILADPETGEVPLATTSALTSDVSETPEVLSADSAPSAESAPSGAIQESPVTPSSSALESAVIPETTKPEESGTAETVASESPATESVPEPEAVSSTSALESAVVPEPASPEETKSEE